jgi:uncharacterized membrane protein YukC
MNNQIDFKKILEKSKTGLASSKKLLWAIGLHAFSAILIFIVLDIIFGGFLFYTYVYIAQKSNPEINTASFQFKDDSYQKILGQWQERDKKLDEFIEKNYSSPFNP